MSKLPDEIVNEIFSYLKDPKDLLSATAISKQSQKIANSNCLWNKFLSPQDQITEKTPSAKIKFFAIKKSRDRREALQEALQKLKSKSTQAKENLKNKALVALYENFCIDLKSLQDLTAKEADKLTRPHIQKMLLEKKYLRVADVLYIFPDAAEKSPTSYEQIDTLNDPALDPLRKTGKLNPNIEKSLNPQERSNLADPFFHKDIIAENITLDYVRSFKTHPERYAAAQMLGKQSEQETFQPHFPY